MKTILIAHNYSKKSFAYMSFELANYLSNNGFKVVFISHKPYFKEEKIIINKKGELIITSWSSIDRPTGLKDFFWFIKIYKKHQPNYVIGHFVGANISTMVSKILSLGKTKCFVYYHTLSSQILSDLRSNSLKYKFKKTRKKIFFKLFIDIFICPSELSKKDIIRTFGVNLNKTKVVLNAIEDRKNNNVSSNLQKEGIQINYLGRLDPSKNVKVLIASFIEFKKRNPNKIMTLSIAGTGQLSQEVKKISNQFSFINFLGGISYHQVDDFLSKGDYTIIPSLSDNLPTVGLESLMNGIPIIISNTTGLSKYCLDNVNSIVILPNETSLIKAFEEISKGKHDKMNIQARALYEEKFSIENYHKEIIKIINSF
ncbi:glycosyltransferase involved in cell wall biosynthesis [Wenyingzhuangia heitensis]|uniref:Glycosyltransferase involved in cell wall biosynthesis n=1 Tax=Wenyingzhuangia heitensis TaxID=1487859 RepID=A0ABX0UD19_9FLAO|nr:glycosyltransferase family 4 protein [Wenyingzhuangia heitensis]NIJ45441.1 glycosyltransferase involved in cell wall biosynthesis [Wenyingzhuangia heitensis]